MGRKQMEIPAEENKKRKEMKKMASSTVKTGCSPGP